MREEEACLITISEFDVSGLAVSGCIVFRHEEAFTIVDGLNLCHDSVVTVDRRLDKLNIDVPDLLSFPLILGSVGVGPFFLISSNDLDLQGRDSILKQSTRRLHRLEVAVVNVTIFSALNIRGNLITEAG